MRKYFVRTLALGAILLSGSLVHQTNAAGPATSLSISPSAVTLTADDTQTFTVRAKDADNVETDVTGASTISTNDPLGSLVGATYHAGQAGTWTVQANYQSFTATATITVTPGALAEITINPHSDPEFVVEDSTKTFSAEGFDQHSNEISGLTFTWSVIGDIGTVDANGKFTASKIGTGKLQASAGAVVGQIPVVVKAAEVETPVNSNSNTNAATTTNRNTNSSNNNANGNTNAGSNTNTDVNANQNTNTGGVITTDEDLQCKTLASWLWVVIMVVFLIAVAILYALVPVTKIWPAVIGLGGAIGLVAIHRAYGCNLMGWWDWVVALVTLGLTVLALRQLPSAKPPKV